MYKIKRYFSIHTGGSKFYQAVKVSTLGGGPSVSMLHYGPRKLGDFPNLEGHTLTVGLHDDEFGADAAIRSKIAEKKRPKAGGRYEEWDEVVISCNDLIELEQMLRQIVAHNKIEEILDHMMAGEFAKSSGAIKDEGDAKYVSDDAPSVEGDTTEIDPLWGSW